MSSPAQHGPPRRIVSLCPSLTELVFDLGGGDELVGLTRYCVHPAERVSTVEQVGGTKDPDVGRIVALAPDLVLLNAEENRREDAEALRGAGIDCHVSMPKSTAETADMVRSIGAALGRNEPAQAIAADIKARSARVCAAARDARPVSWSYLIWRRPWMTVNHDTFVDALLTQAGGRNVFGAAAERYPRLTVEQLGAADPDLILLGSEPFAFESSHADELASATGLPRARFVLADGELLSWHGSRTPRGIDYAESLIATRRLR